MDQINCFSIHGAALADSLAPLCGGGPHGPFGGGAWAQLPMVGTDNASGA